VVGRSGCGPAKIFQGARFRDVQVVFYIRRGLNGLNQIRGLLNIKKFQNLRERTVDAPEFEEDFLRDHGKDDFDAKKSSDSKLENSPLFGTVDRRPMLTIGGEMVASIKH